MCGNFMHCCCQQRATGDGCKNTIIMESEPFICEPCNSTTNSNVLMKSEKIKLISEDLASNYKIDKLEKEAMKNWDKFYLRNKNHFFKDRNWSAQDLKVLCDHLPLTEELVFLEAGCGVGNMLFPICTEFGWFKFYAFDFSPKAIALLKERAALVGISANTCILDLTSIEARKPTQWPLADITTLIFVLSSISPHNHNQAVKSLKQFVKIGGTVVVRDYGLSDHAMYRFGRGAKLGTRFYARQDGTRAYYFKKEELDELFKNAGFRVKQSEYLSRKTVNHQKRLSVDRVFVQGVYTRIS